MREHAQDLRPPLGARPASPPHVKQRSYPLVFHCAALIIVYNEICLVLFLLLFLLLVRVFSTSFLPLLLRFHGLGSATCMLKMHLGKQGHAPCKFRSKNPHGCVLLRTPTSFEVEDVSTFYLMKGCCNQSSWSSQA